MAQTSNGFVIAEKDLSCVGRVSCWGRGNRVCRSFASATSCAISNCLEQARREADFYLSREKSAATIKLLARVSNDARLGLAAVG